MLMWLYFLKCRERNQRVVLTRTMVNVSVTVECGFREPAAAAAAGSLAAPELASH